MRRFVLLIAGLAALAGGMAVAASRTVQAAKVSVMGGPGSFYPKLGDVVKGTSVEVLNERGPWVEVQAGKLTGYVPRSALEESRRGGLAALGSAVGSSEASVSSETAGVKGFSQDVEREHARKTGLDYGAVDKLDRQQVTPEEMEAFLRERGFGAEVGR